MIPVFDRVENIVGKGENAGSQHFLLFQQCFQKACYTGSFLKVVIVLWRFNIIICKSNINPGQPVQSLQAVFSQNFLLLVNFSYVEGRSILGYNLYLDKMSFIDPLLMTVLLKYVTEVYHTSFCKCVTHL